MPRNAKGAPPDNRVGHIKIHHDRGQAMRVDIGSIHVDTGTQRFFPRFRPPRNPILALLYVYAFLLEIYAIIALVLVAVWLGYLAWQWIQRQRAVVGSTA